MKIKLFLKDPDGVYDGVVEAVKESLPEGLSDDEKAMLVESRTEEAFDLITAWVESAEYVTVEIDTEDMKAEVLTR